MCGICGQHNFNNKPVNKHDIVRMADALVHRGPDAEGYFVKEHVGLGHRRLKIIDLDGGAQPMTNKDGSLVVVFNGEIYNYLDLKKELEAKGHAFRSHSDTEVLLHAYEQWGTASVDKLRGMFAFALWDGRQQLLFLARDRLGIKPLYYYRDGETFLFASEIKSILRISGVDRSIDHQAIDDFLTYMYIPAPKSVFARIKKLEPGHIMVVRGDVVRVSEYWDIEFRPGSPRSETDMAEELTHELAESVRVRMMSDVPLGAFLSGGIDSSAVVGLLAQSSDLPVTTLSIGFQEQSFNEIPYAREMAQKYSTRAFERIIDADAAKIIDDLAWYYDEPFADSSMVPTYYVSQAAREQVTVSLSGDGGDENFAGYRRYKFDFMENKIRQMLPAALRRPLFAGLAAVYPKADWLPQMFRAKTLFKNLSLSPERGYFNSMSWFNNQLKRGLYSGDFAQALGSYEPFSVMQRYFDKSRGLDPLSRIQYVDMKTYLVDDILTKVDRASMAHSLEVRVPFLDHQFMQFAASLPAEVKLRSGEGKFILKKAVRSIVPDSILDRPKQGFSIPLAQWLRTDLRSLFEERLFNDSAFARTLFDAKALSATWQHHQKGLRDYSYHLWAILMLESWAQTFEVNSL